jgi:hypothetical protein
VASIAERVVSGEVDLEDAVGSGPYPAEVMRVALLRAHATG